MVLAYEDDPMRKLALSSAFGNCFRDVCAYDKQMQTFSQIHIQVEHP